MADDLFQPLFTTLEEICEADERLSAFNRTDDHWIGEGLPPEAAHGPLPCIRVSGIGSTNGNRQSNEYTCVLTIWGEPDQVSATNALAQALQEGMNSARSGCIIHCMGWANRDSTNYSKVVFPLRFYL